MSSPAESITVPVPEGGPAPTTLERYADLAVHVGVHLQPDQTLVIRSPIETASFARTIAARAYAAGAHDVHIDWEDEQASLLRHQLAPASALSEYPEWRAKALEGLAASGAAFLSIAANDPDLLRGIDPERIAAVNRARMAALSGWYARITGMRTTWSIVSVPTPGWAAKVFPDLPPDERVRRLWDYILQAVRVDAADPVQAWRRHLGELGARAAHMNSARFRSLHFTGPGTDLTVDLPEGHLWVTSPITDPRGIAFVPNMPTEEIFTLAVREGVHGTVAASMPLNYRGALIEDLRLRFEAGRVVAADARSGRDTLQRLIDTDDGSGRIGEVALVPHGSAVSRLGTLFYNTLFDENAACHLALGRAYPMCLEGGPEMDAEQLQRRGATTSLEHVDFMIGSPALCIDGAAADGAVVPVMRRGVWAFSV